MTRLPEHARQAMRGLLLGRIRLKSDAIPYDFEQVPRRKMLNAIRTESSVWVKPRQPWGWPTHLMVEPTNLCNLHCALCPVNGGFERPQGLMKFALFTRLMDEVGSFIFTLQLWDWGEPFVHPDVYEMIAYAKSKGIRVISSTNGHLFAKADHARRLVRSGLDTIIVAIDGATQETYSRYRQGGQLEQPLEGIRRIVEAKRELSSPLPAINFRFIPMAHNEHEIPMIRRLAKDVGADVLSFKTLNNCQQDPYRDRSNDACEYFPKDARYHRFRTDAAGRRIRRRRNPCKQLWNNPSVHWDGTVTICSLDPQNRCVMGDLREHTFREIWRGESYARQRAQFREDWNRMLMCGECSYAYEGGSLCCETIAEAEFHASFGRVPQST
ncbi:MAG: SPASM domain-containing protein [Candidatus Eisenbacteria bacterium]|nr:SPASM domain-containing protein [Candidatus Eisenbacteria bacterium]